MKDQKETVPFSITTKIIKYLGIHLPKKVKTCTQKTIRYWWKESKLIEIDVEIYHVISIVNQYCENNYTIQSNLQI